MYAQEEIYGIKIIFLVDLSFDDIKHGKEGDWRNKKTKKKL